MLYPEIWVSQGVIFWHWKDGALVLRILGNGPLGGSSSCIANPEPEVWMSYEVIVWHGIAG